MTNHSRATFCLLRNDERGAVVVEFAMLAPVLLLILTGVIVFGLVLNQYVMLWNGVGIAAQQFAVTGSGVNSPPASGAWNALTGAAEKLTSGVSCTSGLCMTLSVSGTPCLSNANSLSAAQAQDQACRAALQAAEKNPSTQPAVVNATYPCSLTIMQYNFWPNCQLSAQVTELIE